MVYMRFVAQRLFDTAMAGHAAEWYAISKAEGLALGNRGQMRKIAENLRALQRGLTGDRTRIASGYMDDTSALQAYLLYYWPVSFYETAAVLAELAARRVLPNIQTVLDLGSGPGPGSFAASLFGAKRALLVDASRAALDAASRIAEKGRQGGVAGHGDLAGLASPAGLGGSGEQTGLGGRGGGSIRQTGLGGPGGGVDEMGGSIRQAGLGGRGGGSARRSGSSGRGGVAGPSDLSIEISTLALDLQDFSVDVLSRFSSTSKEALAQAPCEPCFDLIIASHSINELWPDEPERIELRRNMLLSLLPALREGGILLIIEPSAHYTSIPLLTLRDSLLEAARSSERENFIASAEASATSVTKHAAAHLFCVGPCPHSAPCPMRAIGNRPCFSEWKWDAPRLVRELAEMAGLDRSSLKASWVAFQKTSEKLGTDSTRELNTVFARQAASSAISGRIVSEPMLNKAGRIRYIVCTANGQLSTISAPQSDPAAMRAEPRAPNFFNLARGDLIQANELEERGLSHFGIIPSSSLKIIMKAPRF